MPLDDARQRQQVLSAAYPTYESRVKLVGDNRKTNDVGAQYHTPATAKAWNDHYARDFGSYDPLRAAAPVGAMFGDPGNPDPLRTDTAQAYDAKHNTFRSEADRVADYNIAHEQAQHKADHAAAAQHAAMRGTPRPGPMRPSVY